MNTHFYTAWVRDLSFWARLLGHLGFAVLMVLSVVLATERVLYIDSAAQLYEIIQRGGFVIYDHRFSMAITQSLPLLASWLHLPLRYVLVAYSLAAPLLGYLLFLLLAYRLGDVRLGLLLLLPLLCVRHTFFHAISETFSLMFYATLLAALLAHLPQASGEKALPHAVAVVLSVLACVFIHPIGMFVVLFLLGYYYVDWRFAARARVSWLLYMSAAVLVAASVLKLLLSSAHDASFFPSAAEAWSALTHLGRQPIVWQFLSRMGDFYLYPMVLYLCVLVHHCRRRRYLPALYGLLFGAGFMLMTLIVYRQGDSSIGVERSFLPLVFLAGLPFVREVVPSWSCRGRSVTLGLLTVVLLLSFGKIVDTSKHYRQRNDRLQEIVDEGRRTGLRKLVAEPTTASGLFAVESWCTGLESMLLSSLDGPEGTVNLFLLDEPLQADKPSLHTRDAYLAVPWWLYWPYSTMRPHYFSLPEQPFSVLTYREGKPHLQSLEDYLSARTVAEP